MIISCYHGDPGRPQPCPSMCPVQEWPRLMFRPALLRRNGWVLRRKYRKFVVHGDGSGHALPPLDDSHLWKEGDW